MLERYFTKNEPPKPKPTHGPKPKADSESSAHPAVGDFKIPNPFLATKPADPDELPEDDPALPPTERCLLIMERMWARRWRAEAGRQYADAIELKLRREYREELFAIRADLKQLRDAVAETIPEQPARQIESSDPGIFEELKEFAKQGRTFSVSVDKVPAKLALKLPAANARRNP